MNILKKADSIVYGEQQEKERQYGKATDGMLRASKLASIVCAKEITPADIAKIQICLKLSRESVAHKEDNLIDLCGYASILNELEESAELNYELAL